MLEKHLLSIDQQSPHDFLQQIFMYGAYFDPLQYPTFSQSPQPSFSSLHSVFSSELESPKVELKESQNLVLTFSETADVFKISQKYLDAGKYYRLVTNPFHATSLFLYPMKTSETLWFSNVFRGVQRETIVKK